MKKEIVHAVHETDLEEFLESLGILDKIREGRMRCAFCGRKVTLQNLQSIFPRNGKIKVSCSRRDCFKKAVHLREEQGGD